MHDATRLSQPTAQDSSDPSLVGPSRLFQQVLTIADAVAANDCVVLLEGESGTGKELIADRIHRRSQRTDGPFIPVNCPAVTETLFESQFYGHVKGSFTGAQGDTFGLVRAADGGTLFLDEIGEMPLHLQPKLLRLLQEKEVTPVGGTEAISVDVRFIAATNRSLARAVEEGKFRRDLYHRLNIVRIEIPPLRKRPGDIEPLVDHYLEYFAADYGSDVRQLDETIRGQLRSYDWPGNVRELCCWVERLYAANLPPMAPGRDIWDDHYATGEPIEYHDDEPAAPVAVAADARSLADAEAAAISKALAETEGNRTRAAEMLNIHRTTLLRKMKQYGLAD
ncbi:MAG: AAA domain-containing protein [Planctomycetes bacterium]|jgi:transcriptional regulator with PAS, ATPase and Fis domain|nr:sigma 54-interacting transcriptional regulator [Phycisphaerae bacterium]NBB95124.1 AAA domain-containing protein [Planctomycetota bacterium]